MKLAAFSPTNLWLYSFLSRWRYLKSYKSKIMVIAFLGTHIPLLSLLFYFVISTDFTWEMKAQVIVTAILATLLGTALTLLALHNLLAPVTLTFLGLRQYLKQKKLPHLPTNFTDEAGTLMADTFHTLKQLDEAIDYLENYDHTSGLPNRALFRARLQQAVSEVTNKEQKLVVMIFGLERLNQINHTRGHSIGDLLVRSAAQRLTSCLGDADIISRVESNKFAILLRGCSSLGEVSKLAKDLLHTVSKPFLLDGYEVRTGANIGISIYPSDQANTDQLMTNADTAMYQAKQLGRNNYQFYSADLNANLQERLELENDLHKAVSRGELLLHYQPQVDVLSGQIIGVEALIRWQHPQRGMVSPGKFIPIAEETGLIVPIGEWILRTACTQHRAWIAQGITPRRVAVNISARQFKQPNFVDMVACVLKQTDMDASYLELEITESLLMDNINQAITTMQRLYDMGIKLSLDDFGTGYSSLSYLKRFPIHTLKIDQSFVRDLVSDSDDAAITLAIISLAHSLELSVIAEGVETQAQFDYLKASKCNEIQGYYFSRPLAADALTEMLKLEPNFSSCVKVPLLTS